MPRKSNAGTGITLPTFGAIDIISLGTACGLSELEACDYFPPDALHHAIELVLDSIFKTYLKRYRKTRVGKSKVKYEFKKFEVYLAVYLENGTVSYTIRLNTINNRETLSCDYFDSGGGVFAQELLPRLMADFSRLAYECARLPYAWEWTEPSSLYPVGLRDEKGGIPWGYGEALLTKPMRY